MRNLCRMLAVLAFVGGYAVVAVGQAAAPARNVDGPDLLTCSPAPCVLSPTAATHGGFDAPVAADPVNPNNLIVGVSDDGGCPPQVDTAFSLSTDGGTSWNDLLCMPQIFPGGQQYIPAGNPVLGYDRNGVVYIGGFYLNDNGMSSFGFEGFEKSSDGVNWTSPRPAVILKHYDPDDCWMAVDDNASSPYVNSVYVSCVMVGPLNRNTDNQVVVAHSDNGGATWQQVSVAPPQTAPDVGRNTSIAVGADGTVYLAWMYCNSGPYVCDNNIGYMVFSKSSDGGNTWSKPTLMASVTLHGLPNTYIGFPNTPGIAVDASEGSHSGNVYVVVYNWTGTFLQVQVVRSTDGGNTWSKPVPVAPGITHDQFLPWISVSPGGLVGVSWLDRRNDPANIDYQAYAAISANGGQSFQPNVQLTTGFSDPNAVMGTSIGNYTGDTWDGPNYFLAAWMDNSQTTYMQDFVGGIRLK
jgi:hypothetical protein